jgi:hypothetical protein
VDALLPELTKGSNMAPLDNTQVKGGSYGAQSNSADVVETISSATSAANNDPGPDDFASDSPGTGGG